MKTWLLALSVTALLSLSACGGSSSSAANDESTAGASSASAATTPVPSKKPSASESNPLVEPTSSPSTMEEVGERFGLSLVKKTFIVEATKKVDKYPDNEAGEAALTEAAARGCQALKDSGGGDAARDTVRTWADDEGLKGKDAQAVFFVALVSVCPEAEDLLPRE